MHPRPEAFAAKSGSPAAHPLQLGHVARRQLERGRREHRLEVLDVVQREPGDDEVEVAGGRREVLDVAVHELACRASQFRVKLGMMRPPISAIRMITMAMPPRVAYSATPAKCASR